MAPVGTRPSINYYSINKNGKIRATSGEDKNAEYDFLWGVLTGIDLHKDEFEGETVYKYLIKLEGPLHGEQDILQVGEASSAARGIILSLYSIGGKINQVKLTPYNKIIDGRTYTNVWIEHRSHQDNDWGKTPEWDKVAVDHMPEQKEIVLSDGRKILDDGERRKFIRGLAARIKKNKLNVRETEYVDEATGEVYDGRQLAEATYAPPPAPEKHKATQEEIHADFQDMDDDLPF